MMHEFTVIIGVNATGKQQRWIYRVSGSEQSVFLRKMQDEKKYIESGRDLYAKTLKDVVSKHIESKITEEDLLPEGMHIVGPIDSADFDSTDFDGF